MANLEQPKGDPRIRYAGVAALVAAAVVAAVLWLLAANDDGDSAEQPTSAGQDDTTPSVPPLPMTGPVEPGTYAARFLGGGGSTPDAILDVPDGFVAWNGSAVLERKGPGGLGFWTVAKVRQDPCDLSNLGKDPGPSVADLAAALRDQQLTRASRPRPTMLDGHTGLYLELSTPERVPDGTTCPAQRFDLWTVGVGSTRFAGPGEVLRLWILDVDDHRLVVNASADALDERRIEAMVDSVRFVDPET